MYPSLKFCIVGLLIIALLFFSITAIIRDEDQLRTVEAFSADSIPVPVIDAGHGGLDGGAVGVNGVLESAVNLSVALRVEALLRFLGSSPVMTRNSEELDYPAACTSVHEKKVWDQKRRAELVNQLGNAVFISIHQNYYPDPRPNGCEVLYGTADGSAAFAELLQSSLRACLCPENRRVAAPVSQKIYLMKQISCPAVLIECGFLSNAAEAEKLTRDSYQRMLSAVICASYCQFASGFTEDIYEG